MPKVKRKDIMERAVKMRGGWTEGAKAVAFMDETLPDFSATINAVEAKEKERDDLKALLVQIEDTIDDMYLALDEKFVNVANGVRGSKAYGNDSPLYGSMGFIRKSDRASGLTRKTKPTAATGNGD